MRASWSKCDQVSDTAADFAHLLQTVDNLISLEKKDKLDTSTDTRKSYPRQFNWILHWNVSLCKSGVAWTVEILMTRRSLCTALWETRQTLTACSTKDFSIISNGSRDIYYVVSDPGPWLMTPEIHNLRLDLGWLTPRVTCLSVSRVCHLIILLSLGSVQWCQAGSGPVTRTTSANNGRRWIALESDYLQRSQRLCVTNKADYN